MITEGFDLKSHNALQMLKMSQSQRAVSVRCRSFVEECTGQPATPISNTHQYKSLTKQTMIITSSSREALAAFFQGFG